MVKAASEVNHVSYSALLIYWRKTFAVSFQAFNARLILRLMLLYLIKGGGNLKRDFSSAGAFECCGLKLLS